MTFREKFHSRNVRFGVIVMVALIGVVVIMMSNDHAEERGLSPAMTALSPNDPTNPK